MEYKHEQELHFHRLESYQDFLRNEENVGKRGVYVYGFVFYNERTARKSDFIPYYVGRFYTNIHARIQKHIKGIWEEGHRILLKERLTERDCWKYFKYRNYNVEDYAYIKDIHKTDKKNLQASEYINLLPHIRYYIDNLYITYISVNDLGYSGDNEKNYINKLERYVQEHIVGLDRSISREGTTCPDTFKPIIIPGAGTEHLFSATSKD